MQFHEFCSARQSLDYLQKFLFHSCQFEGVTPCSQLFRSSSMTNPPSSAPTSAPKHSSLVSTSPRICRWWSSWLWTWWRRLSRTSGAWWMWPGWPPDPMLPTWSRQKLSGPCRRRGKVTVTKWNMRVIAMRINLHSQHPRCHHNPSLFSPDIHRIDASLIRCREHLLTTYLDNIRMAVSTDIKRHQTNIFIFRNLFSRQRMTKPWLYLWLIIVTFLQNTFSLQQSTAVCHDPMLQCWSNESLVLLQHWVSLMSLLIEIHPHQHFLQICSNIQNPTYKQWQFSLSIESTTCRAEGHRNIKIKVKKYFIECFSLYS